MAIAITQAPARDLVDAVRALAPYIRAELSDDHVVLHSVVDGRTLGVVDQGTGLLTVGGAQVDAPNAAGRSTAIHLLRHLIRAQLYHSQLRAASP